MGSSETRCESKLSAWATGGASVTTGASQTAARPTALPPQVSGSTVEDCALMPLRKSSLTRTTRKWALPEHRQLPLMFDNGLEVGDARPPAYCTPDSLAMRSSGFLPGMSIVRRSVRLCSKGETYVSGIAGRRGTDGRPHNQRVHGGLEAFAAYWGRVPGGCHGPRQPVNRGAQGPRRSSGAAASAFMWGPRL